ncbi:hypothetical protein [Methanobrevibacter sp.]|uniref:hypothetical protein n=1 Tax=Methanobrevibacter sp. TaxID=66852 RepID=UPI00388EE872
MNVKGLKINDILNIDLDTFNNLNESQLRAITSRLVSAGNKRIRRLEEHNINSPALQGLGKNNRFSTKLSSDVKKGNQTNKLREEFARARSFLVAETSTIKGFNKYKERTYERLSKEMHIPKESLKDILDVNKLFEIHHKLQQKGLISSYAHSKGSIQGRNQIAEMLLSNPNLTAEEIERWYEENYEEVNKDQEETENETPSTKL